MLYTSVKAGTAKIAFILSFETRRRRSLDPWRPSRRALWWRWGLRPGWLTPGWSDERRSSYHEPRKKIMASRDISRPTGAGWGFGISITSATWCTPAMRTSPSLRTSALPYEDDRGATLGTIRAQASQAHGRANSLSDEF